MNLHFAVQPGHKDQVALSFALILSLPGSGYAGLVSFQYNDTVSASSIPAVNVGTATLVTVALDNGGTGTASQTWTATPAGWQQVAAAPLPASALLMLLGLLGLERVRRVQPTTEPPIGRPGNCGPTRPTTAGTSTCRRSLCCMCSKRPNW